MNVCAWRSQVAGLKPCPTGCASLERGGSGRAAGSLGPGAGAWSLEPGAWSLEPGAWSLERGARSLEPRKFVGRRCRETYRSGGRALRDVVRNRAGGRARGLGDRRWRQGRPGRRVYPGRSGNSVWDGTGIRLFGARNEIVAFQVIVEADARASARSRSGSRSSLASDAIAYRTPAGDPAMRSDRPIQLFSVTTCTWRRRPRTGSSSRGRCGAAASGGLETGAAGAGERTPGTRRLSGVGRAAAEPGDLDRDLHRTRIARPDLHGPSHGDGGWPPAGAAGLARAVRLRAARREQPARDDVLRPISPSCTTGARWMPNTTASRTASASSWCTATTSAARGRARPVHRRGLHARRRLRGAGAGVGNVIVPASFYGPGTEYDDRASAWSHADAWMTFLAIAAEGADVSLHAGRTAAAGVPAHPADRRQRPLEPGAGPGAADLRHPRVRRTPSQRRSTSGVRARRASRSTRARQERRAATTTGSTTAAGRPAARSPSTRRRPTHARRSGPGSSTTCASTSTGTRVHWRHNSQKRGERNQNVWADSITFDNRGQPNKPIDDQGYIHGDGVLLYPGEDALHPDQDRGIRGPISTIQLANFPAGSRIIST